MRRTRLKTAKGTTRRIANVNVINDMSATMAQAFAVHRYGMSVSEFRQIQMRLEPPFFQPFRLITQELSQRGAASNAIFISTREPGWGWES